VGEAATPKRFALRTGLLRNCGHPPAVGTHSVGEAPTPKRFALRTGLLRNCGHPPGTADTHPEPRTPTPAGAHSVGEAATPKRFALGTGLLRNCGHPPPRRSPPRGRSSDTGRIRPEDRAPGTADTHPRRSPAHQARQFTVTSVRPGDWAPTGEEGRGTGVRRQVTDNGVTGDRCPTPRHISRSAAAAPRPGVSGDVPPPWAGGAPRRVRPPPHGR
jgi:hypothetical protein